MFGCLLFDCCLDCLCINSVGIALLGCLHVGLIFDCCVVSCVTLNVAFWRLRCYCVGLVPVTLVVSLVVLLWLVPLLIVFGLDCIGFGLAVLWIGWLFCAMLFACVIC